MVSPSFSLCWFLKLRRATIRWSVTCCSNALLHARMYSERARRRSSWKQWKLKNIKADSNFKLRIDERREHEKQDGDRSADARVHQDPSRVHCLDSVLTAVQVRVDASGVLEVRVEGTADEQFLSELYLFFQSCCCLKQLVQLSVKVGINIIKSVILCAIQSATAVSLLNMIHEVVRFHLQNFKNAPV